MSTKRHRKVNWKALRISVQVLAVLALVVYFLHLVYPLKTAWRPDLLFQLDPLTHIYLLLSGHGVPYWAWAIVALGLLFVVSRIFCGWACPLGALLDFASGVRGRLKLLGLRAERPAPQPLRQRSLLPANLDVYLLVSLLVLAALRQPLLWLLDPIVFSFKFLTIVLLPVVDGPLRALYDGLDAKLYMQDWWHPASDAYQRFFTAYQSPTYADTTVFLLFTAALLGLEFWQKRFWCRYICPLGALTRLTYMLHPLKRRVRPDCTFCLKCEEVCHFGGTAEGDCLYCMECIEACAPGRISFLPGGPRLQPRRRGKPQQDRQSPAPQPLPAKAAYRARLTGEQAPQGISRRMLLEYAAAGAVAFPLLRLFDGRTELPADFIRPPGVSSLGGDMAADEARFIELCIKCGQCMKTCLTNGLQPALTEAGLSALWTPRLISRLGYCEYSCNLCGQVCATGAIPKLALPEKQRQVLGTAYVDRDKCIPYITPHNCTVCEEHCPTGNKAIKMRQAPPPFWPAGAAEGSEVDAAAVKPATTLQPYVDPALCIGCGICETKCPVPGVAAIRVLRKPEGDAYRTVYESQGAATELGGEASEPEG
jgi:ferredoxin